MRLLKYSEAGYRISRGCEDDNLFARQDQVL